MALREFFIYFTLLIVLLISLAADVYSNVTLGDLRSILVAHQEDLYDELDHPDELLTCRGSPDGDIVCKRYTITPEGPLLNTPVKGE